MAFTGAGTQNMSVRKTKEGSHSGIVHIRVKMNGHYCIFASGFLVKVEEHFIVLTAASNLYHKEKGKAEKVLLYFGRELDTFPHGVIVRNDEHLKVPAEHKEGHYGFDYGVISLQNEDYDFNKLPYFTLNKLRMHVKMSEINMITYALAGNNVRQVTMRLTKPNIVDAFIYYEGKTFPGNKGSPLYVEQNGMYVAVGIHVKTASEENNFSSGILITPTVRARIEELVHHLNHCLDDETDLNDQTQLRHQKAFSRCSYQGPCTIRSTTGNKRYDSYGQLRESRGKSSSTLDLAEASIYQQSSGKERYHYADVYDKAREHTVMCVPSNLPLPPTVLQMDATCEEMEKITIPKQFNIVPPIDPPNCSLRSKIANTLKEVSRSGLILMTSSLCELMHTSSAFDQPEEILLELFGAIPSLPTFVLCVIQENRKVEHLSDYSRLLTGNVLHTIRKFTNEKICSIHGTIMTGDFATTHKFKTALDNTKRNSDRFCNSNSLFMDKRGCTNVSKACLVAMAASKTLPVTCKGVEIRLSSIEELREHFHMMNKACTLKLQQRFIKYHGVREKALKYDASASDSDEDNRNYLSKRSGDINWKQQSVSRNVPSVTDQKLQSSEAKDPSLSDQQISTALHLRASQISQPTISSDVGKELGYVPRALKTDLRKHKDGPQQAAYTVSNVTATTTIAGSGTKVSTTPSRYQKRQGKNPIKAKVASISRKSIPK